MSELGGMVGFQLTELVRTGEPEGLEGRGEAEGGSERIHDWRYESTSDEGIVRV